MKWLCKKLTCNSSCAVWDQISAAKQTNKQKKPLFIFSLQIWSFYTRKHILFFANAVIPKAVSLIKDKRSAWLFGSKVSCVIGCVCCVTVHWYSELEHSHTTLNIFSTAGTEQCSQTATFQLECKSFILKEHFCTWVVRVNEIVKRSNKSPTTLRGEGKKKKIPCLFWWVQKQLKDNLLRRYISSIHLLPSLFLSFLLVCFFLFSAQQQQQKGESSEGMKICLVAK